ncbi:MAG: bifunctional 5,10-methylenetetrahydrofolate dehydrogenase/5,10-methenyltetrahydrofolate cyclohydrolase [Treponema sp.]|jgi:methylenetetrahydrofolate dehydrogenase (NADP+)/methenyltetrahydrofolate cyclohydrolase|nr:bifunctional 5,10-methylenetetrahydrofolate dehydrogenase/5,10-methenyltetrahydrofolate cyclohydrolase [Treponema sp.]
MPRLLKGKEPADAMMKSIRRDVAALKARGIAPALGIIRVGDRADDIAYEKSAAKRCEAAGVAIRLYRLPVDAAQAALLDVIHGVNADAGIHGVLLFRPLPRQFDDAATRAALLPAKDIDGITDGSLAGVFTNTMVGFPPCTAIACVELLDHYGIDIAGKRIVVLGRSLVIGRPVAMLLMHRNATITICHTKTIDLPSVVKEADIVVVAIGKQESIGHECFREAQVVIDVGIHVKDDGKLCGDVKFAEVAPLVEAITPSPGGVGALTSAVLIRHVLNAARRHVPASHLTSV